MQSLTIACFTQPKSLVQEEPERDHRVSVRAVQRGRRRPLRGRHRLLAPSSILRSRRLRGLALLATVAVLGGSIGTGSAPASSAECQATRAIFYTSSDWVRLAQGLGADPSPCAQYYISIDRSTANKTEMRPNAASAGRRAGLELPRARRGQLRRLGRAGSPRPGTPGTRPGRRRGASMDAAGFNVGQRRHLGRQRVPVLGAHQHRRGAPERRAVRPGPLRRGRLRPAGAGHRVHDRRRPERRRRSPQYKASLESWFQDSTFWTTMSRRRQRLLLRDLRRRPRLRRRRRGPRDARRRTSTTSSRHPLALVDGARAPRATAAAARSFLELGLRPARQRLLGLDNELRLDRGDLGDDGRLRLRPDLRDARVPGGERGSASPGTRSNTEGLDTSDFNADVAGILDRLAGSIHETDGGDPTQACEATGCSAVIDGAGPATGWSTFSTWTPTTAVFVERTARRCNPATPSGADDGRAPDRRRRRRRCRCRRRSRSARAPRRGRSRPAPPGPGRRP